MKINQNGLDHKHCSQYSSLSFNVLKMLTFIFWKYGVVLKTRWQFWSYLVQIFLKYPDWLGAYLIGCIQMEHFLEFRQVVKDRINEQLLIYKSNFPNILKHESENLKIAS